MLALRQLWNTRRKRIQGKGNEPLLGGKAGRKAEVAPRDIGEKKLEMLKSPIDSGHSAASKFVVIKMTMTYDDQCPARPVPRQKIVPAQHECEMLEAVSCEMLEAVSASLLLDMLLKSETGRLVGLMTLPKRHAFSPSLWFLSNLIVDQCWELSNQRKLYIGMEILSFCMSSQSSTDGMTLRWRTSEYRCFVFPTIIALQVKSAPEFMTFMMSSTKEVGECGLLGLVASETIIQAHASTLLLRCFTLGALGSEDCRKATGVTWTVVQRIAERCAWVICYGCGILHDMHVISNLCRKVMSIVYSLVLASKWHSVANMM